MSGSVVSIIGVCLKGIASAADLAVCKREHAEAGALIAKRETELVDERRQAALTAVCEKLCHARLYPAYADYHAVLRSMKVVPDHLYTFRALYDETNEFYVTFHPADVSYKYWHASMSLDGPYLEIENKNYVSRTQVDLRTFPPRVIGFLYAMRDGALNIAVWVENRVEK